jgi:hypothetical protein
VEEGSAVETGTGGRAGDSEVDSGEAIVVEGRAGVAVVALVGTPPELACVVGGTRP